MNELVAIFPGTFDPITFGHIDIIKRASIFCDKLIVGVVDFRNSKKKILFSDEERLFMICEQIQNFRQKICVKIFNGLLVDFAKQENANLIIRGLRPYHDFGFEFRMACVNKKLNPDVETIFLASLEENQFISSTLVKEVGILGGDLEKFLPERIAKQLKEKLKFANN